MKTGNGAARLKRSFKAKREGQCPSLFFLQFEGQTWSEFCPGKTGDFSEKSS